MDESPEIEVRIGPFFSSVTLVDAGWVRQPEGVGIRFVRGAGLALGLAGSLVAWRSASAADIEMRCARLSRAGAEELDARVRLAFLARPITGVFPLAVVCDRDHAWLETSARSAHVPIDERAGLVEGALDAIESLSTPAPAAPATSLPTSPAPASPTSPESPPPNTPLPAYSIRPSSHPFRAAGGIGLAVVSEPWPSQSGTGSLGPKLDIALPISGPFAAVASESVRFGLETGGDPSTSLVDVQAGVAWGAPYASRLRFGWVALVGLERFAASPADEKLRGVEMWTATASIGARAAVRAGPLVLLVGLDGVLRAARPETQAPAQAELPRVGPVLSVGFFYPAESSAEARAD